MNSRVVVVGSVNVDLTAYVDEIPSAGETKRGVEFAQSFGGKGANQAVMAARCGVPVSIIGGFGSDENARMCKSNFERNGVDYSRSFDFSGSTGVAHIWVEKSGENRIVIIPGANERLEAEKVAANFLDISDAGVVVAQFETPIEVTERVFLEARERGITTILNPAPFRPLTKVLLANTDWLVVNQVEYESLADLEFGGSLIVTLGEAGAFLV